MYLRKRIEILEASLAPRGRPVVFWAMIGERAMTNAEIAAETETLEKIKPGIYVPVQWTC